MSVLRIVLIPEMDHPGWFVVIVIIFQMLWYTNTKSLIWVASTAASYSGVSGLKS